MGSLDYFCYISRNKVDQLYEQVNRNAVVDITKSETHESSVNAEAKVGWGLPHVLSLFHFGGTYGRKEVTQREEKLKETYIGKLKTVLAVLAEEAPIPPLTGVVTEGEPASKYRHFHGPFRLDRPVADPRVDTVITLRNFSEGPMPDGTFMLNSANARFFDADLTLSMTTVFVVLELRPERVIGSPLFLKLSLDEHSGLTAL